MKTWDNKQHEAVLKEKKRRKQEEQDAIKEAEARYLGHLTRTTNNKSNEPDIMTLHDWSTNF